MANVNQLYTKGEVYLDGALLDEQASVTVARTTGSSPVKSTNKGYSGESIGSPMTEITVKLNCPLVGFQFEPSENINELKQVTLTVWASNSKLTVKGSIISDNFSHATDDVSSMEFSFRGGPSEWV